MLCKTSVTTLYSYYSVIVELNKKHRKRPPLGGMMDVCGVNVSDCRIIFIVGSVLVMIVNLCCLQCEQEVKGNPLLLLVKTTYKFEIVWKVWNSKYLLVRYVFFVMGYVFFTKEVDIPLVLKIVVCSKFCEYRWNLF